MAIQKGEKMVLQKLENFRNKDIVVKIAMLTEYKDEEPIRIGKKAEKEETAE